MTERPGAVVNDPRTCAACSHLRVEHKLHGIGGLPETFGRGWCHCCSCPQFVAEPDDAVAELSTPGFLLGASPETTAGSARHDPPRSRNRKRV